MNVSAADIGAELKLLRRGRGISAPQISERIGPALRAIFQISDHENNAAIRQKASEGLLTLTSALPDDLRVAVLAAFALHEQAQNAFYQDRVRRVASLLGRDDRTARRRIDEGIEHLAILAMDAAQAREPVRPSRMWHTQELRVAVALDQQTAEAFEFRRIVADSDNISELDLAMTLASRTSEGGNTQEDVKIDVFHGGRLTTRAMESSERIGLGLQLPKALERGERHDFTLRIRALLQHTHFVCVPRHPVDLFDLHIRFALPVTVQVVQLDRVFQDDVRDGDTSGLQLTPDVAGEVHVRFRGLAPGFAYGVRWSATSATGIQTH
ncbi:hypothetical protein [Amycolatopsis sp. lyj-112]|uniref:hypothetical protein n=1 Tax=Amycolatopsis sp. lyj-112 TaxID=2789288 RepID=UPI0039794E0B